jgi:3-oxoacyl-[acyl-carrier protein] reductase
LDKFNQIYIGQVAEIQHIITQEDVNKFVDLTGDDNRLHTDKEYASRTTFKKPVVHGMLGASFISTIIGTKLPGDGSLWFSQSLEFILPVRIGDIITVTVKVLKKDDRDRVVDLETVIKNQYNQIVTKGVSRVKVIDEQKPVNNAVKESLKKIALVVGGSGGIGSAVSLALAQSGFDVAVHYYKNIEAASSVANNIELIGQKSCIYGGDITNEKTSKEMVENVTRKLGKITVLVNCATEKIPTIKFQDVVWDDYQSHINSQIKGVFNSIKSVLPYMEERKYGKIINIITQALETPSSNWSQYITAKGALMGFSRSLAYELAAKGIMLNMVSPGMTDTDLISDIPDRIKKVTAARTPLNRLATVDDIANAIVFLASDKSNFMCGETMRINGGQVMI